ncbi:MAG TPA: hypothetical protein VKE74_26530, partial [Gemmataceae bacterium]|nr:hypothetical protein [Gemmataceae bacterium]
SAEEWFNEKPEDAAALARRINELRTGCSKLIFSPHEPLPEKDREWLVGKCREWAKKMDDHLTALEAGADLRAVRADVDQTVTKLSAALRERAAQPG